jgi:asparagine synthase (glutamine-hydrolysing)
VTVCLSGDGSDEIFAGYPTYAADRLRHLTAFVPRIVTKALGGAARTLLPVTFDKVSTDDKIRRFLRGHPLPWDRAHYSWRVILDAAERHQLVKSERREAVTTKDPFDHFDGFFKEVSGCHYLDQAMYVDIKTWLPDDILVKVDQATMAHGLEARPPFLDHRLVEFAAALPVSWKLKGGTQKRLLRHSQARHLPGEILRRRKKGFNAPVSHWFAGPLEDLGRAVTLSARMREWYDTDAIESLWTAHRARRQDFGLALFGLTCLGLWMDSHG